MNEDKTRKEFESKLGKLTLLEDEMESYYTVVNPNALWSWIETVLKEQESQIKQSILKAIMERLRKLSHEIDKRGYDWRHDAVVRADLIEFESVIKEILGDSKDNKI